MPSRTASGPRSRQGAPAEAGNTLFSFFGLMTAVLWCLLYWQQRRLIMEPPVNMPMVN